MRSASFLFLSDVSLSIFILQIDHTAALWARRDTDEGGVHQPRREKNGNWTAQHRGYQQEAEGVICENYIHILNTFLNELSCFQKNYTFSF